MLPSFDPARAGTFRELTTTQKARSHAFLNDTLQNRPQSSILHIAVLTRAAFPAIAAEGRNLVRPRLAGAFVDICPAPGIIERLRAVDIGPGPPPDAGWRRDERGEPRSFRGIVASVDIIELKRTLDALDLQAGCLLLGLPEERRRPGTNNPDDDGQDCEGNSTSG